MSDSYEPGRPKGRFNPLAVAAAVVIARKERVRDTDSVRPGTVHTDDRSRPVLLCAQQFGSDGRSDDAAVAELRRLAGIKRGPLDRKTRRETLNEALQASRFDGEYLEHADANLAYRLLGAAADDVAVTEAAAGDLERIAIVEAFEALAPDQRWVKLVHAVPELATLDIELAAGSRCAPATAGTSTEERLRRLESHRQLHRRLAAIIGPNSGHTEGLLSTEAAAIFAHGKLEALVPAVA